MKQTARRNSFSARSRRVVVGRRSILPDPASPAPTGCADAICGAPAAFFGADRDEDLALRFGMGLVRSVASRSVSTFAFGVCRAGSACTSGVGGDLEAELAVDAGRGAGTAESAGGDAAAFEEETFSCEDCRTISVTAGRGVNCHTSHATQPTAKSISMAVARQKNWEASLRAGTE